jgi:hypothetical protein
LATDTPFYLYDFRHALRKVMSRRDWKPSTVSKYNGYIGQLLKAGKGFAGDECVFGVIRIKEVCNESLKDMPRSDVVREGGREGESVAAFVKREQKYFKSKEEKTVDWHRKRTVVVWEWIVRWYNNNR